MNWACEGVLKRTVVLAAVLALTLALAAPAFAGSATQDGYGEQATQVQGQVQSDTEVQGQVQSDTEDDQAVVAAVSDDNGGGGALPFTGLGLAVIAGTGAALLGAGVAMRFLARRPGSTGQSA